MPPGEDLAGPPAPGAVPGSLARPIVPARAMLATKAPVGDGWLCEVKFDGYRMLAGAERDGRAVIRSRNGKDWTARFPEIADELAWLADRRAWLDGEIVAFRPDGVTSFEDLQAVLAAGSTGALVYVTFDLLALDGWDLRRCRQDDRSRCLHALLNRHSSARVRASEQHVGQAPAMHRAACEHQLEGIIAKRAAAPYRAGPTKDWRKLKCHSRQELVVVGYTAPAGSRTGFGALLLGYHQAGTLVYAGSVGTGFTEAFLARFGHQLRAIERPAPTVALPRDHARAGVHWVAPRFVAEIRFAEWTRSGRLRHAAFLGLREDKPAAEVVRETPADR